MMYLAPGDLYLRLLKTHHQVTTKVYVLNNARQYLADASSRLLSGGVDMDVSAETSRVAKLTLLDPMQDLGIDPTGYAFGSQYYDRMLQIFHEVSGFDGSAPHTVPIFTGPITKASRDGVVLSIEAKGMEILLQDGLLRDFSYPVGWTRFQVIQDAIINTSGERSFNNQTGNTQVLTAPWSMEAGENLWEGLQEMCDAMGMNIFYNGAGICQVKPKGHMPVFSIDSTWMTEDPEYTFDMRNLKNVVRMTGAVGPLVPGQEETRMSVEAWPSPQHPFSPQSLARNGALRIVPIVHSDDSLGEWENLWNAAWLTLNANLRWATQATAVTATIPFLEEYDVININHPKVWADTMLSQWSITLVGDAEMSLNFTSTSSAGIIDRSNFVSNAGNWGRLNQPGVKHGPSGAFNPLAQKYRNRKDKQRKKKERSKKKNRKHSDRGKR